MQSININFFADIERVSSDLEHLKALHGTSRWNALIPREKSILAHHIQVLTELVGVLAEENVEYESK